MPCVVLIVLANSCVTGQSLESSLCFNLNYHTVLKFAD